MVLGRIHRDAIQPSVKCTVAAELGQRPISLDEGLLTQVFRLLGVRHEAADQRGDPVLIAQHQQVKGVPLAFQDPVDQLLIGVLGHR